MSIAGNLATMGLEEILQWISIGEKSGTLVLVSDEAEHRLVFSSGAFVGVPQPPRASTVGLNGRLGVEADPDGGDRQQILAGAERSIADLIRWPSGDFRFLDGERPTDLPGGLAIDATRLMLRATRRLDRRAAERRNPTEGGAVAAYAPAHDGLYYPPAKREPVRATTPPMEVHAPPRPSARFDANRAGFGLSPFEREDALQGGIAIAPRTEAPSRPAEPERERPIPTSRLESAFPIAFESAEVSEPLPLPMSMSISAENDGPADASERSAPVDLAPPNGVLQTDSYGAYSVRRSFGRSAALAAVAVVIGGLALAVFAVLPDAQGRSEPSGSATQGAPLRAIGADRSELSEGDEGVELTSDAASHEGPTSEDAVAAAAAESDGPTPRETPLERPRERIAVVEAAEPNPAKSAEARSAADAAPALRVTPAAQESPDLESTADAVVRPPSPAPPRITTRLPTDGRAVESPRQVGLRNGADAAPTELWRILPPGSSPDADREVPTSQVLTSARRPATPASTGTGTQTGTEAGTQPAVESGLEPPTVARASRVARTAPILLENAVPTYPADAPPTSERVVVEVRVLVGEDGRAAQTALGSDPVGHGFDSAALDAASSTVWTPAADDTGAAIAAWVTVRYRFAPRQATYQGP